MSGPTRRGGRVDRREFIVGAAGAMVVVTPLAASVRRALAAEPAADRPFADWSIDDMWSGYPRYAEPIGFARPQAELDRTAAADPVDLPFLA